MKPPTSEKNKNFKKESSSVIMRSFLVISCALSALWICASATSVAETVAVKSIVEDKDDDTVVVEGKQQIREEWNKNSDAIIDWKPVGHYILSILMACLDNLLYYDNTRYGQKTLQEDEICCPVQLFSVQLSKVIMILPSHNSHKL